MANPPDIVQRVTQHIQSFQRSKVQLGEPREVVMPAARVGDLIKHKSFWGALAGAVVGAMVNSAPYLLCGLLGPFGAAARIALTIGSLTNNDPTPSWADKAAKATEEFVNEIFDSPDGEIMLGNSNVLVNGKPIATALIPNSISCDSHALQMIAEGSETVFAAGKNVARKGDKTTCGAIIQNGSPNVFIGSGKAQVAEIADEFSFMQKTLLVAVEMGFPPSKQTLKSGLGKIRAGIGTVDDMVKNFHKRKPKIKEIKGGAYKDLKINNEKLPNSKNTTVEQRHHMPSQQAGNKGRNGGAIVMKTEDHKQTASFDKRRNSSLYRKKQLTLIREGKFEEALEMDIADIKKKFGNKYDMEIEQLKDFYRKEGKIK